jgi:membrane-associated phospholipid phosphatase
VTSRAGCGAATLTLWLALLLPNGADAQQAASAPWQSAHPAVVAEPVGAGSLNLGRAHGWELPPALLPSLAPPAADVAVLVERERRLVPPGLLRYRVPEAARPYVLPYVAFGAGLLIADEYVLRTLKLDSLYIREDGSAAHQAHLVFRAFSHLGDPPVMAALLAGLYVLGGTHERNAARVGGVAYANAISLTAVGKFLTGKERPYVSGGRLRYHGPNPRYASFPSGHSSGTSSVAHVLAHYYPDARLLWYGLGGMAGVSRIGLARHWPSDVWWGWGVGVVGAEGALRERERIEAWRPF